MSRRFHVLCLWIILATQGSALLGNSYEWLPLDHLPAETDVVVFANRPMNWRRQTLSRQEMMKFLSKGAFQNDQEYPVQIMRDRPAGKPTPSCGGVFITKQRVAYFWTLDSERLMRIVTSEGRRCFITLPEPGATLVDDPEHTAANTYRPSQNTTNWYADTYRPMPAAKVNEVVGFFNDHAPGSGGCVLRSKIDIDVLLKGGKPVPCTCLEEEHELRKDAWLTLPSATAQAWRQFGGELTRQMRGDAIKIGPETINMELQVQGLLITGKGHVLYWEQWGDHLLALRDDKGGCCVLQSP